MEACRRGLGTALVTLVVVLGDGAEWIWHYARTFLAVAGVKVIEIVDIYHAFEHLEVVAEAVFGQGSEAAKQWVDPLKERLEKEGAAPVLTALATLKPNNAKAAEEVRKAIGYFTDNAARMDYPRFVALKLPIGSGAVESNCRTVIQEREKGAGMRWTEKGGLKRWRACGRCRSRDAGRSSGRLIPKGAVQPSCIAAKQTSRRLLVQQSKLPSTTKVSHTRSVVSFSPILLLNHYSAILYRMTAETRAR